MVPIVSLLLPVLLSAVAVFLVSFVLHMVFTHHNSDFKKIPAEDKILASLKDVNIPAGNYMLPYAADNKERNTQEYKDKIEKGPCAIITILPPGMGLAKSLILWFIYSIIVGIFAAYIAGRALPPGADYLEVFRFAGSTAFIGYTLALMHESIWYGKSWASTIRNMFDGLIYALITAGIFGWLWPML